MAVEDSNAPHGLKLAIKDYPFAADGLILWDAIKQWVTDYVNHYYKNASLVEYDEELQGWWTEIRTVGHGDKMDEPWWPVLKTPEDLIGILTTIIWVTSGYHSAVNFGQYDFAGYFPNRPSIARIKMPNEDPTDEEWTRFLNKPEDSFLSCLPSPAQAAKVMGIIDVLSTHSVDEEYIGQVIEPSWEENQIIEASFKIFKAKLVELHGIIDQRNADETLKNRTGAGVVPYNLLIPVSKEGVTGQGVPNTPGSSRVTRRRAAYCYPLVKIPKPYTGKMKSMTLPVVMDDHKGEPNQCILPSYRTMCSGLDEFLWQRSKSRVPLLAHLVSSPESS
ncbi:hypothetical protein LguiB_032305 [Lonicera macranthoides]